MSRYLLPRLEVLQMLNFMMGTIPTEEKTGLNCLFVKVDGDNFTFIVSGAYVLKRKTVIAEPVTKKPTEKKDNIPEEFMVPIGDIKGFYELLKSDKSRTKKLQDEDEDKNFIEISDKFLSSFGSHYDFEQPKYQFKNLQYHFEHDQESTTNSFVKPSEIKNLLSGFPDSKQVEMIYCSSGTGEDGEKYIHCKQEATGLEAVFICPSKEEEVEGEGGEQKSF